MFETHDNGKRKTFFAIPGEHHWDYVCVSVPMPWFHVTCTISNHEGISLSLSFMLSNLEQLLEITQRHDVKIAFVDLVSPGHMNDAGRWKMEPLKEIWMRTDARYPDQHGHEYILENGKSYLDITAPPIAKACMDKPIFRMG